MTFIKTEREAPVTLLQRVLKPFASKLKHHYKVASVVFLILFFALVFRQKLVSVLLLLLIIILGSLITLYKHITVIALGVELFTFSSVVLTYAFGPVVAIVSVIIMITAADLLAARSFLGTISKLVVYPALCLLVALLAPHYSIIGVGKFIVILMNIIFFFLWTFLWGFNLFSTIVSIPISIVFNFLLFNHIAEPLLELLT